MKLKIYLNKLIAHVFGLGVSQKVDKSLAVPIPKQLNWADQVIQHYGGKYPDWLAQIEPATEDEITYLTELVGFPLSNDYLVFLRAFGHNDGGVLNYLDGAYSISSIINAYEENVDFPDEVLEPGWILFFIGTYGMHLMLNAETGIIHHEGRYDPEDGYFADSLPKLFRQLAFTQLNIEKSKFYLSYMCSALASEKLLGKKGHSNSKEVVEQFSQKYQLDNIGLDDPARALRQSKDGVYFSLNNRSGANPFMIGGPDLERIHKMGSEFASLVGAELHVEGSKIV